MQLYYVRRVPRILRCMVVATRIVLELTNGVQAAVRKLATGMSGGNKV
jgi:hypothetical protein